jgi:hypothetical protein
VQQLKKKSKKIKIDFSQWDIRDRLGEIDPNELKTYWDTECVFENFLRTGEKSSFSFEKHSIYRVDHYNVIFHRNNRLYLLTFSHALEELSVKWSKGIRELEGIASGILIDCNVRLGGTDSLSKLLLFNADDEEVNDFSSMIHIKQTFVKTLDGSGFPITSFNCLSRFYDEEGTKKVEGYLASGRLVLLDYSMEEWIEFSEKEKAKYQSSEGEKSLAPKLGFRVVNGQWHRSGTCLFKDVKTEKYYLLGQDEGTYFGCELPTEAQTIEDAFACLLPSEAKGKTYARQGEWFAVSVAEEEVPNYLDCALCFFNSSTNGVFMPVENEQSNRHLLQCSEGRIGRNGVVYALSPKLQHSEHEPLNLQGWHAFYRNTAFRSVSESGVD